jgi:hypothetical protein
MAKTFSVTNPDVFKNMLARLDSARSESVLRKAAAAGITIFKDEISLRVPRDTGDLASGLSVAYLPENSVEGKIATYIALFVGDTTTNNSYSYSKKKKSGSYHNVPRQALAGWLENGRSKMAARPFVRPSFEAVKQKAVDASKEVLAEALKDGGVNGVK